MGWHNEELPAATVWKCACSYVLSKIIPLTWYNYAVCNGKHTDWDEQK